MMETPIPTPPTCSACGWTDQQQRSCGYTSHITLFRGAGDRGAWAVGADYILKERPDGPPRSEVPTAEFLRKNTRIPVPLIAKHWVDTIGRAFTLTRRIPGQTLEAAWPNLSTEKKQRIADETARHLMELRQHTSSRIGSFDGGPAHHAFLFGGDLATAHGPFGSDDEFYEDLLVRLDQLPAKPRARMRARLPPCAPYTLTHGDLTSCNIIVDAEQGHLAGIIDWENAGYFPVWWEFACAGIGLGDEDADWKDLLRQSMVDFSAQREVWRDFWALTDYPDLSERGDAVMASLLQEEELSAS